MSTKEGVCFELSVASTHIQPSRPLLFCPGIGRKGLPDPLDSKFLLRRKGQPRHRVVSFVAGLHYSSEVRG